MEFFDKLGEKASKTYKATAEKTGKLAKGTRIKFKINELKSSVIDIYEEIGKKVYERHEEGKKSISFERDLSEEIKKLEEITGKITKLNEECLSLKDKRKCPECYFEVEKDANFCSNCGVKLEKQEVIEPELVEEEQESKQEDKQENRQEDKKENKEEKKAEKQSKKNDNKKAKDDLQKTVEVESSVKEVKENDKKEKKESKE